MTAPTMTRLGVLRTDQIQTFDPDDRSVTLAYVDGLTIRTDADGQSAPLAPGVGYEIRPNDGWAVDRDIDHGPGHHGHLVDAEDGHVAGALPLVDGVVILDRAHRYLLRQEHGAWIVYQA